MASEDFFFNLEFSSQGVPASLVEDLTAQVFRYVGCSQEAVSSLSQAFKAAAASDPEANRRKYDVQFMVRNGLLEVLVTSAGGRIWEHAVVIPQKSTP